MMGRAFLMPWILTLDEHGEPEQVVLEVHVMNRDEVRARNDESLIGGVTCQAVNEFHVPSPSPRDAGDEWQGRPRD
jgi:hypothetical protein